MGGVKLMSYGFIAKGASQGKAGAAVMRGPMVAKVVSRMEPSPSHTQPLTPTPTLTRTQTLVLTPTPNPNP